MLNLYYCKLPEGNVGDDFNAYFWPQIASSFISVPSRVCDLDYSGSGLLLGIGSLLWKGLPLAEKYVVFGTGTGYNNIETSVKDWDIYCVRGPLTANYLGIDEKLGIGDGAYLLNVFKDKIALPQQQETSKKFKYSLMLHHSKDYLTGRLWKSLAEELGIQYISSCESPEIVFHKLKQTEVLITEAMHGAIFADIFRIPWIPIRASKRINSFKWDDFTASMSLKYQPYNLFQFLGGYQEEHIANLSWKRQLLKPFFSNNMSLSWTKNIIQKQLVFITEKASPVLSKDSKLDEVSNRLLEKFEKMKINYS